MAKKKKAAPKTKECPGCGGEKGHYSDGEGGDGPGDPRSKIKAGDWIRCWECKGRGRVPTKKVKKKKVAKKSAKKKRKAKKKKKKKPKRKQPTKAEVEKRQREYERELLEEAELLVELNKHAANLEVALALPGNAPQISKDYSTLIRMFRRKHLEAQELKSYLIGLKEFFTECWDEEDEHFDPSHAERPDHFVPGHWCPNLIEEIGEMTEEGTVYVARPIETKAVV